MESHLILFAVGAVTGVLGGYLGIGGAVIITPVLLAISAGKMPDEVRYPLVFSSTLFAILGTSVSAGWAYARARRVFWPGFKVLVISALLLSFAGSTLAALSSPDLLRRTFGAFALISAAVFLSPLKGHQGGEFQFRTLPFVLLGMTTGFMSAFIGVAGGVLMVPVMLFVIKLPYELAIGTSSMVGIVTSLAGMLGYVINGWNTTGLPAGAIGFVYPAYAVPILLGTIIGGPIGSKLNQGGNVKIFRWLFAAYLILIAYRMLLR
ncbi:MAG: sulfite exporter TauE/SafE family protein [bacterium]|nr:sulfite exporter TauE/SafE family protein [bacterium]